MRSKLLLASLACVAIAGPSSAFAANTLFQEYFGDYGASTSGWGSVETSNGTLTATVPVGSTVTAAYLYTSTYDFTAPFNPNPGGPSTGTPSLTLRSASIRAPAVISRLGERM